MDEEFRKTDVNKDGQLTRPEVEIAQRDAALSQMRNRNRALFGRLDTDRNGQISPSEFAQLTGAPRPANGQPLMVQMDGNKDQKISIIEHRTAKLANFDKLDTDKDSVISPAELRAAGIAKR
jgi:Ca2+-binding EF-hand superfamily protein